jgi:hypothetical protein
MVHDPGLAKKVDDATPRDEPAGMGMGMDMEMGREDDPLGDEDPKDRGRKRESPRGWKGVFSPSSAPRDLHPPTTVEQVVGVILGSPEFQRR